MSLFCTESRDHRGWAPEPQCLGTRLWSKHWSSCPHLAFPFLPCVFHSFCVFLVQCGAISALGAGREVSAALFCWLCFHTPLSPSSWALLCASPEHPFPACAYKSRLTVMSEHCPPCHQYHLLLVTGLTSQTSMLLVALPLFGISCQAAMCCSRASPWHAWCSCFSFHCWNAFTPPRSSFRAVKDFSSWISKVPIVLNALLGYRASSSSRSSRETWCTVRAGRCLEMGKEQSFVQAGVTSSISCTAAGWQVSRGSCHAGCSSSCWIWE